MSGPTSLHPVLVIGGNGQLATMLERAAPWPLYRVGRPRLDFDRPETLGEVFRETRPSAVVNAAAWTAVDAAETDPNGARRANMDGPAVLASLCEKAAIPFIHVSTDYVFDGLKGEPYVETDPTSPTGVYGRTKLAGEEAVRARCPRATILRTSWVYSPTGSNFVRTMLRAGAKADKLRVVADQRGCPTSAHDLAVAIGAIVDKSLSAWRDDYAGVFHAAGAGSTTWHGLAVATFAEAARYGARSPIVEAISTADWPTPARRPPDSRLDGRKLHDVFGVRLPEWRASLRHAIDELLMPEVQERA